MPWDCLRLVLNDYKNDYAILSKKNNTTTIEIKRLRTLAIEIFKTISNIIPNIMKDIFNSKSDPKIRPSEVLGKHHKSAKYGDKSLIALGTKIWNQPFSDVKYLTSITKSNPIQDGLFRDCSQMGDKKAPSLKTITCILQR